MKKTILLIILSLVLLFSVGAIFQLSGRYQISGNLSGSSIPFILDTKTGAVWKCYVKDSGNEFGFTRIKYRHYGNNQWIRTLLPE